MSNLGSNISDFDISLVTKKLSNLKAMQYLVNSEILNKILLDYKKRTPDNDDLDTMINAVLQIHFYVSELENEIHLLKIGYEENRNDKIRAIERARRVEKQLAAKKD